MSRVIYGAIIGLALIVAVQSHPPEAGVMVVTLCATALAVALAELYSDVVGTETRTHRRVDRARWRGMAVQCSAVAFGIAFPVVFFVLAAAGAMELDTAFTAAKWSGLGLIVLYGFVAGRLSGRGVVASILHALTVGLIGMVLIAVKALLH